MTHYTTKILKSKSVKTVVKKTFESVNLYQRNRKFKDNKLLSSILIRFITCSFSFAGLALLYFHETKTTISTTAFKKQFQKCDVFQKMYENLLNSRPQCAKKSKKVLGYKQCFLLDTTSLKEEGAKGEVYRIHTCYAATRNQVSSVRVTDSHTAESVMNFDIEQNALYLADRAYCTARQITYMCNQGADFIFRMKYNGVKQYVDKKCTKRLDLVQFLQSSSEDTTSKIVYVQCNHQISKIRIVAVRLNDTIAQKHQKSVHKKAGKRGDTVQQETLDMCHWLILATSLMGESNKSILKTYRLRWQIELFFKRFKTFIKLHKIRKSSRNFAFSYIFLSLIVFFAMELFVELNEAFFESTGTESLWVIFSFASAVLLVGY